MIDQLLCFYDYITHSQPPVGLLVDCCNIAMLDGNVILRRIAGLTTRFLYRYAHVAMHNVSHDRSYVHKLKHTAMNMSTYTAGQILRIWQHVIGRTIGCVCVFIDSNVSYLQYFASSK